MLDHIFLTVSDIDESIAFYEAALRPLGIIHVLDYDGRLGPPGHPDLKGFGRDSRIFFWLRQGSSDPHAVHIGFVARSNAEVDAFHAAAMHAGAGDNGNPGYRDYYDPRYYAASILDPDGHSIEVVYKNWQHVEA
jgi:catechol 2,3-dioxygenase-like lactoylglutathione lyase family enzyme